MRFKAMKSRHKSPMVIPHSKMRKQIQEMTRTLLKLPAIPKPDDTADALAMAICHGHASGSLMGRLKQMGRK